MDKNIRRQLTLFVHRNDAQEMEAVRRRFNPVQRELIDCHVTLCREDEIEDMDTILSNLRQLNTPPITIQFGPVTRFENGSGVMLPALGDNDSFHGLRSNVLAVISPSIRRPDPHITLMHPRNSTCTDEIFSELQKLHFPTQLVFDQICLIEQINGGKWHVIQSFTLKDS